MNTIKNFDKTIIINIIGKNPPAGFKYISDNIHHDLPSLGGYIHRLVFLHNNQYYVSYYETHYGKNQLLYNDETHQEAFAIDRRDI